MINCTVELWGLPREVTGLPRVEVQLESPASLPGVVAALRKKAPALVGAVIRTDEDWLEDTCAFSLRGQFYLTNEKVDIQNGDRIRLITLATGG